MGGNALKNYETKRLNKADYESFNIEFQSVFISAFGFLPLLIKSYEDKSDFGDADYLIDSSKLKSTTWLSKLKSIYDLDETKIFRNTNVISIGYKNFQIDLIVTPNEEMKIAYNYFAYNDFSNLIGRLLHKLGIKLGHNGLWLVVRDEGKELLTEILLSRNYYDALDILGLDRAVYDAGIKNLDQMFNYITTSKYFDPDIFALENRSSISRVRDAKRKTYHEFLLWIEQIKPISNYDFESKSERGGYNLRHPYFVTEVLTRWPWVGWEVDIAIEKAKKRKAFKEIYNGLIVSEITGLKDKELGAFMNWNKQKTDYFLNSFLSAEDILRSENKEQMRNAIIMQYRLYQGISQ